MASATDALHTIKLKLPPGTTGDSDSATGDSTSAFGYGLTADSATAEAKFTAVWGELQQQLLQNGSPNRKSIGKYADVLDESCDGSSIPSVEAIRSHARLAPAGTPLCSLSLLPVGYSSGGGEFEFSSNMDEAEAQWMESCSSQTPVLFCGKPYYATCVNMWLNTISSTQPPIASGPPLQVEC